MCGINEIIHLTEIHIMFMPVKVTEGQYGRMKARKSLTGSA